MTDKPKKPKTDDEKPPIAGPHDKPGLRNPDATPGAGTLPADRKDDDAQSG